MLLWRINKVSDVGYEMKCVSLFESWWPSWAMEDGNLGCSDTDATAYLLTKTFFSSSVMPLKFIFHCIRYSISIEKCIPPTLRRLYFGPLSLIREGHQKKSPKTETVYWMSTTIVLFILSKKCITLKGNKTHKNWLPVKDMNKVWGHSL